MMFEKIHAFGFVRILSLKQLTNKRFARTQTGFEGILVCEDPSKNIVGFARTHESLVSTMFMFNKMNKKEDVMMMDAK